MVSGGRTGNALNDYNASKQLTLPDWRGRALAGLDDMGNSAAGRLTASFFGTAATVLGAAAGSENTTLTLAQLPTGINTTTTVNFNDGGGRSIVPITNSSISSSLNGAGGASVPGNTGTWNGITSATGTGTSTNTSGTAHRTVQPTMLATIYLKL